MHHTDGAGDTTVAVREENGLAVDLSGTTKPHILRVLMSAKPAAVTLDGRRLAEGIDWRYDSIDNRLWVTTSQYTEGRYQISI